MSIFPDLLPEHDNESDLGSPNFRWRTLYTVAMSDGVYTIPLSDIATKTDVANLSVLPLVGTVDNGKFLGVKNSRWAVVDTPPGVLPFVTEADDNKYLVTYGGYWRAMAVDMLPIVTVADNGYVMRVVDGHWQKFKPPPLLPVVTGDDNGKILQVYDGVWSAVNPPADVLPLVSLSDHGKVLMALRGMWSKKLFVEATETAPGLVPKLPGSAGRVLSGRNTWITTPSGASGQWRVGDIKTSMRAADYGWISASGGPIPFEEKYEALYLASGGTPAGWAANTPINLPNVTRGFVRYLPDSTATADMGILFIADGSDNALATLHFELEIYDEAKAVNPVLTVNTLQKARTLLEFTTPLLNLVSSSAPGWFWWDNTLEMWRLFSSAGEKATIAARAPVLIDLAEVNIAAEQHRRLMPGSYYIRWRQVTYVGGNPSYGSWRWQRILSTGGMNAENTQLVKLCDIFSTGLTRAQTWTLPRLATRVFSVTSRGLTRESGNLLVGNDMTVTLNEGSMRATRVTIMGQGYLRQNEVEPHPLDWFSVIPQYTSTEVSNNPVSISEITGVGVGFNGAYAALAFNADGVTCGADADRVIFYANTSAQSKVYDYTANTISTVNVAINQDLSEYFGARKVANTQNYHWVSPPRNDLRPRRLNQINVTQEAALVAAGSASWAMPYFTKCVAAEDNHFFMPAEAPGIWDVNAAALIPLPANTIFKGSKAVVRGVDGCIYCMPRFTWSDIGNTNSTGILRFDPQSKEITFIKVPWDWAAGVKQDPSGWWQALTLRDGKILFVPLYESHFLVFDPQTDGIIQTTGGATLPIGSKWRRSAVLQDGTVAGFGTDVTNVASLCYRFNPDNYQITTFTFPKPINAAIRALAMLPDGSAIMATYTANSGTSLYVASCGDMPYRPCALSPLINMR